MTKSTKIIAGLGVVAALGGAMIPMTSYAANSLKTEGEVELTVAVDSAITMTIKSSGDDTTYYSSNPESATERFLGDDLSGYTAFGVSSATAAMAPNEFNDKMNSVITVYTNADGYKLTVRDADDELALVSDEDKIEALTAGDVANFSKEGMNSVENSAWGWKGGDQTTYTGITAGDVNVKTETGLEGNSAKETTVTYGVLLKEQASGVYSDTIVYTATSTNS